VEDKELFDRLEKVGLAEKLEASPEWALVKEAANRIVEKAVMEFITSDPSDMVRMAQLQIIIKKYKFNLFREINSLKQESTLLYEEAADRGIKVGDKNNLV